MNRQQLLAFDVVERQGRIHDYCDVSGLSYWPGFLTAQEQWDALNEIDQRDWQTDLKRRVQHYGYKYDYKARAINPSMYVGPLPTFATEIGKRLHSLGLMSEFPDQVIVNEYLPGQGITAHIDCEPCFKDEIATISLGSEYVMDLTDTESDASKHIRLELGSCLVFSGDARYRWKHGIKARKSDDGIRRERRVSMTFRTIIPSGK